jgi:hypothetical protein
VKENSNLSNRRKNILGAACVVLGVLLIALALPLASRAQDTGYISGTVSDKSGAAIVGAAVTVTGAGGLTRNTTTNGDGAYTVAGLPGGNYDVVVTATGFQKFTAQKVVLDVAEKRRIDIQLTVGTISSEVVVTGDSIAQVSTESSEISSTITGTQIAELELNGRNFTQLVNLSPGVVSQQFANTGTDDGVVGIYGNVSFSINGGRSEYNNWELDGGDNMDNGSNATLNVYPNPEAIAEFKVLTSSYGAQYGRNGSGTVEVETKSGASSFHGSAFEYNRNEFFKAKSWAEGQCPTCKKAPYKKNDYGYTIGGPVYIPHFYNEEKKKTFFFFSQEWRKEKVSSTILQNVPSDAERRGDFTALCTHDPADCPAGPHVITPTAVGTALLAIIPNANTTNGKFPDLTDIPAVQETISSPTTWREQLFRVDHNLTDKYRLTFRYIHDSWQTVTPNALWGNGSSFQNVTTNFVGPGTAFLARMNANITPTLLNEFVASYTGDHIFLTAVGPVGLPSGFAMGSLFNNGFGGKLPAISLGTNNAYGGGFTSDTGYFPCKNANPTYTYRDNMTKVLGKHTLQFGAYLALAQKNEGNSPYIQGILTYQSGASISTGNAFADLLLGNIHKYQQTSAATQYYNRYKIVEPYFQDDWRVTKRLTLNLGLRVSLFGTYRERYKQAFNFDPSAYVAANAPAVDANSGVLIAGAGNPFDGIVQCGGKGGTSAIPASTLAEFPNSTVGSASSAGCLKGHLFNPAPRIGFAFDPKGDGKMAIRGGYGIFYEHTNGNEGNTESLEGSAPLVLTSSQNDIVGYGNIGAGGGLLFPLAPVSVPNKAVWPYMQQWNLNVQKELPAHFVVSLAYVGSKGTHLTLLNNANQIVPVSASANPYKVGEAIGTNDCSTLTTPSGVPVTGQALVNLNAFCGNGSVDALRTNFPGYGNISTLRDAADSSFNSFQFGAKRTIGDLTLSVAYTYSHSIDDSSDRSDNAFVNAYNLASNRASSNFDVRHNAEFSYVYSIPLFKGAGMSHNILGGWQVSGITVAQTGIPFNIFTNTDNAGVANGAASNGGNARPDLVGKPGAPTAPSSSRGPLAFNAAAFAAPRGLTFGTLGRNALNLPDHVNFDFGLFKNFAIREKAGFEFRWETFNIFNHTEYSGISSTFTPGSTTFLHLNATHDPRRMQFGLRFYF